MADTYLFENLKVCDNDYLYIMAILNTKRISVTLNESNIDFFEWLISKKYDYLKYELEITIPDHIDINRLINPNSCISLREYKENYSSFIIYKHNVVIKCNWIKFLKASMNKNITLKISDLSNHFSHEYDFAHFDGHLQLHYVNWIIIKNLKCDKLTITNQNTDDNIMYNNCLINKIHASHIIHCMNLLNYEELCLGTYSVHILNSNFLQSIKILKIETNLSCINCLNLIDFVSSNNMKKLVLCVLEVHDKIIDRYILSTIENLFLTFHEISEKTVTRILQFNKTNKKRKIQGKYMNLNTNPFLSSIEQYGCDNVLKTFTFNCNTFFTYYSQTLVSKHILQENYKISNS